MKRWMLLGLLLASLGGNVFAQRDFEFRVSLPNTSLGFGLEAELQRDLVALIYSDLFFSGPSFILGGEVLFKPDLGQFDRDLRGIRPYFGGGVGLYLPSALFTFTLDGGIEFSLDRNTGVFIGGQSLFPLESSPRSRVLFGATFR